MTRVVVLDIEGTTSTLSYVRDELFPYSYDRFPEWVESSDPEVAAAVERARLAAGLEPGDRDGVVRALRAWVTSDAKVAPLKTLQGLMWEAGFASGELRAHVYDDVPPALRTWTSNGAVVCIYSSGSERAQRAWFSHTQHGDLSGHLSRYFDLDNAGPKREPGSYASIASSLGTGGDALVFLSDVQAELDAARAAGWLTVGVRRPDDPAPDIEGHPQVESLEQVAIDRDGAVATLTSPRRHP
jgi:enolase-phosphatase E1